MMQLLQTFLYELSKLSLIERGQVAGICGSKHRAPTALHACTSCIQLKCYIHSHDKSIKYYCIIIRTEI